MADAAADDLSFEKALAELEEVVHALEDGQLPLEEALARYENGVGLLKRCFKKLADAEQRIALLAGADGEGKPVVEPFDHTASMAEESRPASRRRKST